MSDCQTERDTGIANQSVNSTFMQRAVLGIKVKILNLEEQYPLNDNMIILPRPALQCSLCGNSPSPCNFQFPATHRLRKRAPVTILVSFNQLVLAGAELFFKKKGKEIHTKAQNINKYIYHINEEGQKSPKLPIDSDCRQPKIVPRVRCT